MILDDRDASPGTKFKDADLIGFPVQVVVGRRGLEQGEVEVKVRSTGRRAAAGIGEAAGVTLESLRRLGEDSADAAGYVQAGGE